MKRNTIPDTYKKVTIRNIGHTDYPKTVCAMGGEWGLLDKYRRVAKGLQKHKDTIERCHIIAYENATRELYILVIEGAQREFIFLLNIYQEILEMLETEDIEGLFRKDNEMQRQLQMLSSIHQSLLNLSDNRAVLVSIRRAETALEQLRKLVDIPPKMYGRTKQQGK